ncbi:CoA ester lyase [Nocardioides cavernae]|uniref:CoA ester lyase n=1 Tax=Nocardioides cavernae TaxID=1921566 RepID=A0ABR8NDJ2_9ACTN|nr:CoA ester lyase [Nocardioides cavernae]MBD3926198.1 CoA ester lyase [Nocardioides cavernae]MBM7513790.1 citrate lyase subunit beta/citryl-CoA lyase [Nocardioides cavernae]
MPRPPVPRCALVVPASHPRMVAKALVSGADEVVLDLEDAVAPDAKDAARAAVVEVLEGDATPSLAVRVNQVGTPWCHRDVLAVADLLAGTDRAVTIVVPKVESAADVGFVERLLRGAAPGARAQIDVLVESAPALRDLDAIVSASSLVRAVVVGYADLAADVGRDPGADPTLWDVVRHQVVVAARAAGRAVIDGPWLGTADDGAFTRDRERARALGFDGTWVIHPAQVEAASRTYSPSTEQLDWAERVVSALEHSVAGGAGAVALDGQMLDEAVALRARAVLARAEALR